MDVLDRADLPFPHSLPEFQRLFPDDAACAAYLEKARWGDGFACPHCGTAGEPFHFENRPGVLRCRKCRQNTGLTVGTVMERSHTPLNVWFRAAYLVASQTPGMSAVQFQRQLGLSRYETAFQILHKLRSGMVRPNQDRIGGQPKNHVEVDETWVGGRTRGEGRGVHHKVPVSCAIEVRHRKPGTKLDNRKDGRYAGRVRLAVVLDRSAESLCGFVESTVAPGSLIVTDDWSGYAGALEAEGRVPVHAAAALRLLMLTGCRRSEIMTLRWEDVHLEANEIRLRDSKTGPRVVPLSPGTARVLAGLPRDAGNPWVIAGRKPGTRFTHIGYYWYRVRERAGLDDVRLHDLRHSFASRALAVGESLSMIGKLLGHTKIQTTARYAHLARDSVKESAARVAASIGADILP